MAPTVVLATAAVLIVLSALALSRQEGHSVASSTGTAALAASVPGRARSSTDKLRPSSILPIGLPKVGAHFRLTRSAFFSW
jgi:hypothetical protein